MSGGTLGKCMWIGVLYGKLRLRSRYGLKFFGRKNVEKMKIYATMKIGLGFSLVYLRGELEWLI